VVLGHVFAAVSSPSLEIAYEIGKFMVQGNQEFDPLYFRGKGKDPVQFKRAK
jgi:hypothetical protein